MFFWEINFEKSFSKKVVVSNKVSFGKKDFKPFVGYKDAKKIDLYVYFFQKCLHIEEILMKLDMRF